MPFAERLPLLDFAGDAAEEAGSSGRTPIVCAQVVLPPLTDPPAEPSWVRVQPTPVAEGPPWVAHPPA
eukprot:1371133-Prymnesium_polylepis.1